MNCHFWNTLVFLVRSLSSVAAATLVTFSSPRQRLVDLDTVAIAVAVVIASPRRSVTSGLKGKKRETWRQLFFYYFVFPPFLHLAAKTPDSAKRRVARATAFRASRGRCDWSSAPGPRGPLLQRFLSCPPPFPPVLLLLPWQVLQWCVASSKPRAEKRVKKKKQWSDLLSVALLLALKNDNFVAPRSAWQTSVRDTNRIPYFMRR